MRADDITEILRIQAAAYADAGLVLEDAAFFLNRLALSAATCQVAQAGAAHALAGYVISYPWTRDLPPALNLPLDRLPDQSDCWFVHDCAVDPVRHGQGVAGQLLRQAQAQAVAQGLRYASLVSLADACTYWLRRGYQAVSPETPALRAKLAGYGPGAAYMCCALPPDIASNAANRASGS